MAMNKILVGGFVSDEVAKINANFNEVESEYAKKTELPAVPEVPTKTSQLTNDSKYQTDTQVASAIQTAIAATGHAVFTKVNAIPNASEAEANVLYLFMNASTGHYDIYAKVDNEVILIDDTTVNLTGYATTQALNSAIATVEGKIPTKTSELNNDSNYVTNTQLANGYVAKVEGKSLSTNDYTNEDKSKVAGLSAPENKTFTSANWTANNDQYTCTIAANGKKPGLVMRKNGSDYCMVLVDVKVSGTNIILTSDEAFEGYIVCI